MEQLDYNLLSRWFVGLSPDDPTFTKNRERLQNGEVFTKFMTKLLNHPQVKPLLSDEHFSVDGTLIEAWASHKSFRPKDGSGDEDGGANFHGQQRKNDTHASTSDPDSRLYRKAAGREAKLDEPAGRGDEPNASAVDEGERNLGDRLAGLPGCAQSMWSRMRFGFRPAKPAKWWQWAALDFRLIGESGSAPRALGGKKSDRLRELDGLRGLAALSVFFNVAGPSSTPPLRRSVRTQPLSRPIRPTLATSIGSMSA